MYIEKKVKLLKTKVQHLNTAVTNTFTKNIIMIKYNGRYQPVFLPIARYYNKRKKALSVQDFDKEIQTHNFVYNAIFDGVFRYFHVITTKKSTILVKFLFI